MPTDAWIRAASRTDRRPVLHMAVESVDALQAAVSTKSQWDACPVLTHVYTGAASETAGTVILATDSTEPHYGEYTGAPVGGYESHINTHRISAVLRVNTSKKVRGSGQSESFVQVYAQLYIELWADLEGGGSAKVADAITCYNGHTTSDRYYTITGKLIQEGTWNNIRPVIVGGEAVASEVVGAGPEYDFNTALESHTDTYQVYYLPTGQLRTTPIDLGLVPTDASVVNIDDVTTASATLAYTARGRNATTDAWTSLGAVSDGSTIAAYRYYDFTVDFASLDGITTPELNSIGVSGGNSQFIDFSTHDGIPVKGARPYLAMSLGTLSSKLELMKLGTTGEVSPHLMYLPETFALVRDGELRNKTVSISLGFVDVARADYEPLFTGLWYDYSLDLYRQDLAIKTRTIISRFQKVQLPRKTASGDARTDETCPVIEWINRNIILVMLDVMDLMGIQGRYIHTSAFTDLCADGGPRAGADWDVSRRLDKDAKEDATKLLEELSVLSGVFIRQLPDGRLCPSLYDASAPIVVEINADVATFSPVDGGQAELYTRQQICYALRHEDDLETGTARGAWAAGVDVARNDSMTIGLATWYCIQSHRTAPENAPGTGANFRAFWATEWSSAYDYLAGEVCLRKGPLYTCSMDHTATSDNEPGVGANWRGKWTAKPVKSGSSATDYYNEYVLINDEAEEKWGLHLDPLDPQGPGYQKTWLDKWNSSLVARADLASRMDSWFANPKMKLKATNLPPAYWSGANGEELLGAMIGVTGLILPVSGAVWGTPCDKKKFLVMGKTLDPVKCTVSLDLLEV